MSLTTCNSVNCNYNDFTIDEKHQKAEKYYVLLFFKYMICLSKKNTTLLKVCGVDDKSTPEMGCGENKT